MFPVEFERGRWSSGTTLGHRGRKRDPLYKIRKLLLKGAERLDGMGLDRMLLEMRLCEVVRGFLCMPDWLWPVEVVTGRRSRGGAIPAGAARKEHP